MGISFDEGDKAHIPADCQEVEYQVKPQRPCEEGTGELWKLREPQEMNFVTVYCSFLQPLHWWPYYLQGGKKKRINL